MCGIAGLYHRNGHPVKIREARHMATLQRHRGPDDSGLRLFSFRHNPPLSLEPAAGEEASNSDFEGALSFCRLSILDTSLSGHQPMLNRSGSVLIVFNGEIYNAFDFREELIRAGYEFKSRTDTEVLLHMIEHVGLDETLRRINGMFAFALVDLAKRELHLVRDRVGIKPLYYYENGPAFLFASEVKAFFASPAFRPELAGECLDEFFMFRYCAGERHLLRGVKALLPGHVLTVTAEGCRLRPYWDVPSESAEERLNSPEAAEAELEKALRRSVSRQLLSDVPLGCQLSGGVDSLLVTLYGNAQAGHPLHAISITLGNPRFSEEPYIDIAASRSKAIAHKHRLDADFFTDNLLKATWHLDQPINHPNSIGIYLLAKRAREWVTVLLSGEGADELLGGYPRYAFAGHPLRRLAGVMGPMASKMPRRISARFANRFGWWPGLAREEWFIASTAFLSPGHFQRCRPGRDMKTEIDRRRSLFKSGATGDYVKDCMRYDMKTFLVDLLVRQDKMTMAHSVENRVPFLDNEMLDLFPRLPGSALVRPSFTNVPGSTKIPLKRIAARYFGSDFAWRSKSGFSLPLAEFMEHPTFIGLLNGVVIPGIRQRGLLPVSDFEAWWRRRSQFDMAEAEAFFVVVAFELWAHLFLDGGWKKCGMA